MDFPAYALDSSKASERSRRLRPKVAIKLFRLNITLRAFAETADAANGAAAFMLNDAAAVGAGALKERALFMRSLVAVGGQMVLDGLGHGIRAGQNFVFSETGMGMTGNALQLLDDLARLKAASPGQ